MDDYSPFTEAEIGNVASSDSDWQVECHLSALKDWVVEQIVKLRNSTLQRMEEEISRHEDTRLVALRQVLIYYLC